MKNILPLMAVLVCAGFTQAQSLDYNGHHYSLLPAMTFQQAETLAELSGGHLATIHSTVEFNALAVAFETTTQGEQLFVGTDAGAFSTYLAWFDVDGSYSAINSLGVWQIGAGLNEPASINSAVVLKKYRTSARILTYRAALNQVSQSSVLRSIVEY